MTRTYRQRLRQRLRKAVVGFILVVLFLNYVSFTVFIPAYNYLSPLGILLLIKNAEVYYRGGKLAIILDEKVPTSYELSKYMRLSLENLSNKLFLRALFILTLIYLTFDILDHLWQYLYFIWQHRNYDISHLFH